MKKILSLAAVAALILAMFSGCGKGYTAEINVCNWGEYIDETVLKDFEEQYNIKVNYSGFNSNEALYSTMKNGGSNYDVIIPSDYMISRLISEDMLEPLDYSNIPNWSLIGDSYKGLEYDPTNSYSVPYMWGTVGIIYNTSVVTKPVTSWDALFDSDYSGQILMFDNPRDALGIALLRLGYSLNTTSEAELEEAYGLLVQQKPLLQAYVMDQIFDKLESGEAAIGPYYAGDFITMHENNPDLAFCIPEEGTNYFVDAMCIPKGSTKKEYAEKFINFMCSTEVCTKNMDVVGYASANTEALESYIADMDEDFAAIMAPSDDVLANTEVYTNLPQNVLEKYDELWVELKS